MSEDQEGTGQTGGRGWVVILLVLIPAGVALGALFLTEAAKSEVQGELVLSGSVRFMPNRCQSGANQAATANAPRFWGVDLFESRAPQTRVRIVEDPVRGKFVMLLQPGKSPLSFEPEACPRLESTLRSTGASILEYAGISGSLHVDCPDLAGQVLFEDCYGGN